MPSVDVAALTKVALLVTVTGCHRLSRSSSPLFKMPGGSGASVLFNVGYGASVWTSHPSAANSVSKTGVGNEIRYLASVAAHRGIERDRPNWRWSPEFRDTDAVSGFVQTHPVFSTEDRHGHIEEP